MEKMVVCPECYTDFSWTENITETGDGVQCPKCRLTKYGYDTIDFERRFKRLCTEKLTIDGDAITFEFKKAEVVYYDVAYRLRIPELNHTEELPNEIEDVRELALFIADVWGKLEHRDEIEAFFHDLCERHDIDPQDDSQQPPRLPIRRREESREEIRPEFVFEGELPEIIDSGEPIVFDEGDTIIEAMQSDGYVRHQANFHIETGDKWITGELTYFRGKVKTKDEQGNITGEKDVIVPIIFYNNTGERGRTLLKKRVLDFDGKTILLEGKTTMTKILPTLMNKATADSFLNGAEANIKDVFPRLKERMKKFVSYDWDERLYDLTACLTIATYFFDVFGVFPIIFFFGPAETGKGRGLKCVIYAGHKGYLIVSPTEATTFRIIDSVRPTLGMDEFTSLSEELMRIVRAAYKEGLTVPRAEEKAGVGWVLGFFETFTALVLASTRFLSSRYDSGAAMSRCIVIHMRKAPDDVLRDQISDSDPKAEDFEDIRQWLYICRLTQAHNVHETFEQLSSGDRELYGREWELWRAPLTIAKMVGEEVYQNVLDLSKEMYVKKYADLYADEKDMLLGIHRLLGSADTATFTAKDLSEALWELKKPEYVKLTGDDRIDRALEIDGRRRFDKNYKPKNIGWKLRPFNLTKKAVKRGNQYEITRELFDDFCQRYKFVPPTQ